MEGARNWKWLLALPVVNWIGLLVAGQEARKPAWIRWGLVYAVLSSLSLGVGLAADQWFLFWTVWLTVAAHSYQVQSEYRNRVLLIQDPQQRLQSDQDMQVAKDLGLGIDINRCSVDDLLRLPGVSIIEARRIVEVRRTGGPFLSAEELHTRADLSANKVRRLEPLLQFCYYEPALSLPQTLDINEATASQLETLEGIDSSLAARIVQERAEQGEYQNLADLRDRLGLNARVIAKLMNRLIF